MAIIYIYDSTATDFTYNGQPLNKAYEAVVDNMINDSFFVTFNHPLDDKGIYKNIEKDKIVKVHTPDGMQPFRIMDRVKYMDHIYIEAWPLFYADMRNKLVKPLAIRGVSGQTAINAFVNNLLIETPFTFTSNITDAHDYNTQDTEERENNPNQLYNALDVFKDIVKRWQGELVINGYDVRVVNRLGKNTGALLYEKKNISDFTDEESIQDITTRLYGKSEWTERPQGSDEEVKYEISVKVESPLINAYSGIVFEKQYTNNNIRTEKEMTDWLNLKFTTENIDKPSRNIKVNTNIVDDTLINLGDSLVLKYVKHDVDMEIRMVGYTYDGYADRYITIQLGDAKQSYVGNVQNTVREIETNVNTNVKQTVNQILNANGERMIYSVTKPIGNFKNGDVWFDQQGGMYFWDEEKGMWIDHPYNRNMNVVAEKVDDAEKIAGEAIQAAKDADTKANSALEKAGATANLLTTHQNTIDTINTVILPDIASSVGTALANAKDAMDEAKKADGKIADYVTTKGLVSGTTVDSKINTATGEISKKITTVEGKIDDLQVGGRNLVLNSSALEASGLGSASGSRAEYQTINTGQSYMDLEDGEIITISFDIEMKIATKNPTLQVYNTNVIGHVGISSVSISDQIRGNVGETINKRVSLTTRAVVRSSPKVSHNTLEFYSNYGSNNFYKISKLKVERGNVATDWTPAPEDNYTKEEFAIFESTYDEDVKGINSTLTELSNKKLDGTTYTDFYTNEYKKTAQGVTDTYAKVNKIIDANGNSTDAFAKAVYDRNATRQSADFKEVTKNLVTTATYDAGVKGINQSITTVQGNLDNIKIGGRNYIPNSDFSDRKTNWAGTNLTFLRDQGTYGGSGYFARIPAVVSWGEYTDLTNVPAGTVTLSASVRSLQVVSEVRLSTNFFDDSNKQIGTQSNRLEANNVMQRYSFTFEVPTGTKRIRLYLHNYDGKTQIDITRLQLETGNKMTDWTPSPEDMQSVAGLDSSITAIYSNTSSETSKAITKTLSAYTTTGNIDGHVANLLSNKSSQTAKGINSKLTAIEGKIPTYVGGRNLFRNSNFNDGTKHWNINGSVSLKDTDIGKAMLLTGTSSQGFYTSPQNLEVNKLYTISFLAKSNSTTLDSGVYFGFLNELSGKSTTLTIGRSWKRYEYTTTTGLLGENSLFHFYSAENTGTHGVYITDIKIEKGTTPTDWSPAPEDMATVIKTNEIERTADYSKLAITNLSKNGVVESSSVNATKDGITERVAKVDANGNISYSNRDVKLNSIVTSVADDNYISRQIQTSSLIQSTIKSKTDIVDLSGAKTFTNLTGYNQAVSNVTGYLIIRTPINSNNMVNIHIGGYNYATNKSDIDIDVSFYRYTATSILNHSYSNKGNFNFGKVQVGTDSAGRAVIVLGLANTSYSYPKITVDKAIIGHGTVPDSYINGWSMSISTSLTGIGSLTNINGMEVQSQITQLADSIDLKVTDSDLISRINVRAGNVLIQSGTNKLNVTPETTYIKDGTIESAMIKSLEAGKITAGKLDASKVEVVNLDANNITTGNLKSINIVNTISYPSDGRTYKGDMTIAGGQISSYVTAGSGYYKSIFLTDRTIRLSNQDATLNMQAGTITFDGTLTGGGQIWYQDNLARLVAGSYNGFALSSYRDGKFSNRLSVGGWAGEDLAPFVDIHTTLNMNYKKIENIHGLFMRTGEGKTGATMYATSDNNLSLGGTWGTVIGHMGSDGKTVYEFLKADQASDRVRFAKNINMQGNTILNQSDERLKHNIYDLERDDLSILKDIRYKNFTFNNQDKETFGFIAQDIQKIMPSLIMEETDGYLSYDSMEYTHFIGHALQQHVTKVDDEITQLKAQVASLQDELAQLKGA